MGFVSQGFGSLLQRYFHATRQGAAQIPLRLYTNIGGLFVGATGSPPPGAASIDVAPHDHSTQAGGAPLPRGVIYAWNGGIQTGWAIAFGEGGGEVPNNENTPGTWVAIAQREYSFDPPVTPGIDSTKLNLSGQPCTLEGWGIANLQGGVGLTGKVRIYNHETGTYSSEAVLALGYQEYFFVDIPCKGGMDNRLTVEAQLSDDGTLYLYAGSIAETRRRSQPASAGAYRYDNLTTIE
jgi:hypothetical protein